VGPFAVQLAQTSPTWASAVAPLAEMVSRILWSGIRKQIRHHRPPSRLTQLHRREAKGVSLKPTPTSPPRVDSYCKECGAKIGHGRDHCATCALTLSRTALIESAARGRIAAQSDKAQAKRSKTQLRHRAASLAWKASDLPLWLDEKWYLTEIQPRLPRITLSKLSSNLGISIPYAVDIRSARRVPHKRHWETLAQLVGVSHA
jgi:ribosomal protein S14